MVHTEGDSHTQEHEDRQNTLQIGFLISNKGSGSNLQAGIDSIKYGRLNAQINLVISDRAKDAQGLERAKQNDIPIQVLRLTDRSDEARDAYSTDVAQILNHNGVQVAVFAGFSTILNIPFFERYQGIAINIHPGSVPEDPDVPVLAPDGTPSPWNQKMMTEKAVANFVGHQYAGSTIHIVTPIADFGPVLRHVWTPVNGRTDVDDIYSDLKREEHEGLIQSLIQLQQEGWEQYK